MGLDASNAWRFPPRVAFLKTVFREPLSLRPLTGWGTPDSMGRQLSTFNAIAFSPGWPSESVLISTNPAWLSAALSVG